MLLMMIRYIIGTGDNMKVLCVCIYVHVCILRMQCQRLLPPVAWCPKKESQEKGDNRREASVER